jgi:hypothetical protein
LTELQSDGRQKILQTTEELVWAINY